MPSQEGTLILKSLLDNQERFSAIIVSKYPKSEWGKYWNLDQPERFEKLEKFTTASELSNIEFPKSSINRFAWKKGGSSDNFRRAYAKSIPLRAMNLWEVDGVWHVDSDQEHNQFLQLMKNEALHKLQENYGSLKPIKIEYKGYRFIQRGTIEQLYDPRTKDILEFRIIRYNGR
jgi:hypothetical protein